MLCVATKAYGPGWVALSGYAASLFIFSAVPLRFLAVIITDPETSWVVLVFSKRINY